MAVMTSISIPESHRDLLLLAIYGVLATVMPDGQPQASVVWVDYDGEHVLLNTTLERQKGRNMQRDPHVTVLIVDPQNSSRWIEVRGRVAEITSQGAEEHADRLLQRYTGKRHFYGDVYPVAQRYRETRVIVKIAPMSVSCDAVFR